MQKNQLFLIASLLLIVGFVHLSSGDIEIHWSSLLASQNETIDASRMVFFELRLPRLLLVLMVGSALGISGAAMQALLRNPLADPALLGVSSGAALSAVMAIYYGVFSAWFVISVAGVIGGLLATLAVLLLAGKTRHSFALILAGVAINALCGSALALALNFAPNPYAMSEMVHWLLGSFSNRSINDVQFMSPFMVFGLLLLATQLKSLRALSLGEASAHSLGISVGRSRLICAFAIALMVGASVATCGNIGFIGLVVPHLVRPWVHFDPVKTIAASALVGALMMLSADTVVKLLSTTQELRVGVVTALIGAPFFLHMIFSLRKQG